MFRCDFCGQIFNLLRTYNAHIYYHRNERKNPFKCKHQDCLMQFKTYSGFLTHFTRNHIIKLKPLARKNRLFSCGVIEGCFFTSACYKAFKSHIYEHLRKQEYCKCPFFRYCKNNIIFKKVFNMKNHFFRKHTFSNLSQANELLSDTKETEKKIQSADSFFENTGDVPRDANDHEENLNVGFRMLSHLYLKLEAKYFVRKTAIQEVVHSLGDLNTLNTLFIKNKLSQLGIQIEESVLKQNLNYKAHNTEDGLLNTNLSRENFYKKNFTYIAPVKVNLEKDNFQSKFYYVPILETLKSLLKNKNVLEQCLNNTPSRGQNFLSDILNAKCCNMNPFFLENKTSLKIILYQDSFEVCNPLGSAKKKHKILGVYMTLANMHPWHRAKVDHIQLVGLC